MSDSTPSMPSPGADPAAARLEIVVNGEPVSVPAPCTIVQLLAQQGLAGQRVAVAVNRDVVPRSSHAEARLAPGDRVEILEAVGGG